MIAVLPRHEKNAFQMTSSLQSLMNALLLALGIVLMTTVLMRAMGREWGDLRVWTGASTPHTSQGLLDPYTFTHVLHGIILYYCLGAVEARRGVKWSWTTKLALATTIEAAWELVENTDTVINKYRQQTASLGYTGDSVINSKVDQLAMIAGFYFAHYVPGWVSLAAVLVTEVALLIAVRDNLTLNVVQLLAPS
jgi:uncharacterized membrane protein